MKAFYEKLAKIQADLVCPKNQYNSFGKYKYRSCEDMLEKAKQENKLLKEEILNEPELHEILTTVGVVLDGKIYKKVVTPNCVENSYYLCVQDYIEPVQSPHGFIEWIQLPK